MAQIKNPKNAEVLVLGTSLSALLIAESERQAGRQVVLLEPTDRVGGVGRPLTNDLDFVPRLEGVSDRLNWLANLMRLDPSLRELEQGPVHFDEGLLKPFVGFGDRKFDSREEIEFYSTPYRFDLEPSLSEIQNSLQQSLAPLAQTRKQVTKLLIQDGRVAGVEINGDETWTANLVVAPQSPSELLELIPIEAIKGQHRTRLAKAVVYGSVALHLVHKSPVTMERGLHILYGGGQESEPVVGRFWPTQENGQQNSAWLTLVPRESNEDTDFMSHALKHLKRQLKRAHPQALESLAEERLVVNSESHGFVALKTKHPLCLPEIDGLLFASPLFSRFRGPLAAVDVAAMASFNSSVTEAPTVALTPQETLAADAHPQ